MSFYWIYDLPTWLFGILTVIVIVAFGLAGLFLLRAGCNALTPGTMPTTTSWVSSSLALLSCMRFVQAC